MKVLNSLNRNSAITIFALLTLYSSVFGQDAETILSNYLHAVGGSDKWKSVESIIILMHETQDEETVYKIASLNGNQIYDRWISIEKNGDSSSTCFNGNNYWRQVKGGIPEEFTFYVSTYARYARLSEPGFLLSRDSIQFVKTAHISVGNKSPLCNVLAAFTEGNRYEYYFNTNTFLLEGYSRGGNGDPITSVGDYRPVDGLMIPFEETTSRSGKIETKYIINKIFLNRLIPIKIYEFPKNGTSIVPKGLLHSLIQD